MSKRTLTDEDKAKAIAAYRDAHAGGSEILANLICEDETDDNGNPVVVRKLVIREIENAELPRKK